MIASQPGPFSFAIAKLRYVVERLPEVLFAMSENEAAQRPSPERWSRKQVIGHLIDSASNNHQRFVRTQFAAGQDFPGYEQVQWVEFQDYQNAAWRNLVELWRMFNLHLLHLVSRISTENLRATCRVAGGPVIELASLFVDYVDHLEHHLREMLGSWESVKPSH